MLFRSVMRKLVLKRAEELAQGKSKIDAQRLPNWSGMIVNGFMTSGFDKETGEIRRDSWNAEAEIESIKKSLGYRQCFIVRMPYEDAGAFWDATIYSPRDPRKGEKLALPLKRGLDPSVYGGYSSEQFAYFFIYEARDKKGKTVYRFSQIPVWLASRVEGDETQLSCYAQKLAVNEGIDFVRVARRKLLKRQLIEIDGERFVVTGKKEMRNAEEVSFDLAELALMKWRIDCQKQGKILPRPDGAASVSDLFNRLAARADSISRLSDLIKFDALLSATRKLSEFDAIDVLFSILMLVNGSKNMVDLTAAGGVKFAGCLQPKYDKLLSDPKVAFYVVDQSVTGMFERKTRVGL